MTDRPEYRFKFEIVDQTTGETIWSDWTFMTPIDPTGGCDSVDIHVGSMLRGFERHVRDEYEREHYPTIEAVS